jgi:hypothetical protein
MRTQVSAFWSLKLLILILPSLTIMVLAVHPKTASGEEQTYAVRRAQMVRTILTQVRDISPVPGHDHIDTVSLK